MCSSEPLVPRALSSAQQLCCVGALNTLVFLPEFRLLRAAALIPALTWSLESCSHILGIRQTCSKSEGVGVLGWEARTQP